MNGQGQFNLSSQNISSQKMKSKGKKVQMKSTLSKKIREQVKEVADKKSKENHIIQHKNQEKMIETPAYINYLTRKDCMNIFSIRSRIVKLKANFKKAFTDTTCRWCENSEETQEHIFTKCPKFTKITKSLDYTKIMTNTQNHLRKEAKTVEKILKMINEKCKQKNKQKKIKYKN